MPEPADRDLVLRTRRGDVQAFGELVRRYQGSVFNVCYRMVGERREAEDLAQEAFLRAYRRLATYDAERPFGPWVRRVAARVCLNELDRRTPAQLELDDDRDQPLASGETGPEAAFDVRAEADTLRRALAELPPRYRAVIELRHYQEMSYAEISEALEIPLSDVKSHLYRARKSLARRLTVGE
jgi:RNA polymerase sigma-70 factor (ECF subfamily)